jgi:hypothetical protein
LFNGTLVKDRLGWPIRAGDVLAGSIDDVLAEVLIRGTLVYFVRLSAYACNSKAPGGKGFVERFAGCGASGWCMP